MAGFTDETLAYPDIGKGTGVSEGVKGVTLAAEPMDSELLREAQLKGWQQCGHSSINKAMTKHWPHVTALLVNHCTECMDAFFNAVDFREKEVYKDPKKLRINRTSN